jgi:hypothetical protein
MHRSRDFRDFVNITLQHLAILYENAGCDITIATNCYKDVVLPLMSRILQRSQQVPVKAEEEHKCKYFFLFPYKMGIFVRKTQMK